MARHPRMNCVGTILLLALTLAATERVRSQPPETPGALGHSLSTDNFGFWNTTIWTEGFVDFPVPGRVKIAENNSPAPRDRAYFAFSSFHNALQTTAIDGGGGVATRIADVQRYSLGVEKTFWDGYSSVELRMPLQRIPGEVFDAGLSTTDSSLGNLAIINKWIIRHSDTSALAMGIAMTVPTGDDVSFRVDQEIFTVRNEAVHIAPFIGFVAASTSPVFFQTFLEVDLPVSGNGVDFRNINPGVGGAELGTLQPQTTLCAGASLGYWLCRKPRSGSMAGPRSLITGVATIAELHYLTSLNNVDTLSGTTFTGENDYRFGTTRDQFDVVLITLGLHTEVANDTTIRVGTALPLTGGRNRFFDSELQIQWNRRF